VDWISSSTSETLFVNCNTQPANSGSPSSYLCSKLHESVDPGLGLCLGLSFFCRDHVKPDDPYFGAAALARSLLQQLLEQLPHTLSRDLVPRNANRIQSTSYQCGILEDVVLRLPRDAFILCAIDSINIHEDQDSNYEEFEEVLESLLQIREKTASSGCVFKLLIACSWNSRRLYKLIPDQRRDVMWLPVKIPQQGGLTISKWKYIMDKSMNVLV